MHDPRAGEAMVKFQKALVEIHRMGAMGFAHLLDTASEEDMTNLLHAVGFLQSQIDRVKNEVGG